VKIFFLLRLLALAITSSIVNSAPGICAFQAQIFAIIYVMKAAMVYFEVELA